MRTIVIPPRGSFTQRHSRSRETLWRQGVDCGGKRKIEVVAVRRSVDPRGKGQSKGRAKGGVFDPDDTTIRFPTGRASISGRDEGDGGKPLLVAEAVRSGPHGRTQGTVSMSTDSPASEIVRRLHSASRASHAVQGVLVDVFSAIKTSLRLSVARTCAPVRRRGATRDFAARQRSVFRPRKASYNPQMVATLAAISLLQTPLVFSESRVCRVRPSEANDSKRQSRAQSAQSGPLKKTGVDTRFGRRRRKFALIRGAERVWSAYPREIGGDMRH